MRILIIQPWIRAGGAELLSVELASQLEVGGDEAPIAALFVRPHGLPAAVASRRYVLPPAPFAAMFARSRKAAFIAGPFVLLALVLREGRRADVLNPHNLPGPVVAAIAGRLLRRPVVWTCNEVPTPLSRSDASGAGAVESIAWRVGSTLARAAARVPREILVLSEKTRHAVRDTYGRESIVARPGIDLGAFRSDHIGGARGVISLLYVAKLHPQKDPLLAVDTLAALRDRNVDASLTMVGAGALRDAVRARIESHGLRDRVRLERDLHQGELVDRYRRSDVLLVTAGGHQSWGLTPFEALAAGTPSVLSDEVGASEVLGPPGAALVVPRSAVAFAAAVIRLRDDPTLAARIVTNGQRVLDEMTWARYARACRDAFARATTHA